jgi:hypothetical protein
VVPVVNRSKAADAPELYSTTIAQPLAEAGYYVMSVPMDEMTWLNSCDSIRLTWALIDMLSGAAVCRIYHWIRAAAYFFIF